MPETRLRKTRATLPDGYQFGDAASDVQKRLAAIAAKQRNWLHTERTVRVGLMDYIRQEQRDAYEATERDRPRGFFTNDWMTMAEARRYRHWNTIEPD